LLELVLKVEGQFAAGLVGRASGGRGHDQLDGLGGGPVCRLGGAGQHGRGQQQRMACLKFQHL
jgi:hypothetical protein